MIKLDAIGDFLLVTPLLRELKRSFPNAAITVVVAPATRPLAELCPYVSETLVFDYLEGGEEQQTLRALRACRFARELQRRKFDLALLPRAGLDYYGGYYLLCGSGARTMVGYERTFSSVADTWLSRLERRDATVLRQAKPEHEVTLNLRILPAVGASAASDGLEVWLAPDDHSYARDWLDRHGANRETVALGIGAREPLRCWPTNAFAKLCRVLAERDNFQIVLIGHGTVDQSRADEIIQLGYPAVLCSAVGALTVRQTAALLALCRIFVGNDSGPMHLAAAVGLPIVEISGFPANGDLNSNFSPHRFGPWKVPARVLQPKPLPTIDQYGLDDRHCLRTEDVDVRSVVASLDDLLSQSSMPRVN